LREAAGEIRLVELFNRCCIWAPTAGQSLGPRGK
jgi:hypothetical protein